MCIIFGYIIPLSANPTKLSSTFKQYISNLLTNCLSVFDHFVGLVFKRLYLLITHIFMRNVSWNICIWHIQTKFYQEVSAILLYLADYLFCSLLLYILSTTFMLKLFLVHLEIQIYLENLCVCIYIYLYMYIYLYIYIRTHTNIY